MEYMSALWYEALLSNLHLLFADHALGWSLHLLTHLLYCLMWYLNISFILDLDYLGELVNAEIYDAAVDAGSWFGLLFRAFLERLEFFRVGVGGMHALHAHLAKIIRALWAVDDVDAWAFGGEELYLAKVAPKRKKKLIFFHCYLLFVK